MRPITRALLAAGVTALVAAPLRPLPLPAQATTPADSLRIAQWHGDLSMLATELERRHPDLFARRDRDAFLRDLAELRNAVPTADDISLTFGVQRLVASLGDSHTSVGYSGPALGIRRLPISPYVFDDGVFIRDADSSLVSLIGARMLRVGTQPIDTVLARLRPFIAHENDAVVLNKVPNHLVIADVLTYIGASERVDSIALEVLTRDGDRRVVRVASQPLTAPVRWSALSVVPPDSLPLFRRHSTKSYWFEYLEVERTMVIGFNRAGDDPADPLAAFTARLGRALERTAPRRVVVDFRLNSGGNSALFRGIARQIAATKRRTPDVELVGIIGRRTFSSGLWNALAFQREAGARLYGEATSGKPNSFGEVREFELPNSKLTVTYSTRRWRRLRDEDPQTLMPDVAVPVLASDHFELRDAALERILHPQARGPRD